MLRLGHHLTTIGTHIAHPISVLIVGTYGLLWYHFAPQTFEWHAIATLSTWMMTLIIQRSAHRDTQAIHAKLDELLRSHPDARTELARLDDEEPEDIEKFRRQTRSDGP